jgi:hypothetical protein
MKTCWSLLPLVLLGCQWNTGQSQPAQPPPGSYGQPAAQQQPAAYPQPRPGTAQPAPAPVPQSAPAPSPLPAPAVGGFDGDGSISASAMRQEPVSVLAELVAALAPAPAGLVRGIPLSVIEDPKEVNAFAGCKQGGGAYMGITSPLLLITARSAEAKAYDELFGTRKYDEMISGVAGEVKAQRAISGPPRGFLPLPGALDSRKLSRQLLLFDEQLAFVLGHELAHHYRGHTGCANGAANTGLTPQDVGRVLSRAVPVFNQPNEIEADVNGTWDLLDAGARRQTAKWGEEGAIMTLDFFTRLQSLGIETVLLGFLMTHPPPQIRLPIVQNAAQQWRANGGHAPVLPF